MYTDRIVEVLNAAVEAALATLPAESEQLAEIHRAMAAKCRVHYSGMRIPRGIVESRDYVKNLEFDFEGLKTEVKWSRNGDVVELSFKAGVCACPLVRSGLLTPSPKLCGCSRVFLETHFREVTGIRADVKILESICQGGDKCLWQYKLYPES